MNFQLEPLGLNFNFATVSHGKIGTEPRNIRTEKGAS
jgi:hypothetical protein